MKTFAANFVWCAAAVAVYTVPAYAQETQRLSATFRFFGSERSTTLKPLPAATGGATIFSRTVTIPPGMNVVSVTMSTTGDTHFGARSLFACRIGATLATLAPCQPLAGDPDGAAPTGWITLQRHIDSNRYYASKPGVAPPPGDGRGGAGDMHDNSITYQWCVARPQVVFSDLPYTRVIQLRMASLGDPTTLAVAPSVFIEGLHVFVDASYVASPSARCLADTTILPSGEEGPGQVTIAQ